MFSILLEPFFELWETVGGLRVAGGALEELLEAPGCSRRVHWGPLGSLGDALGGSGETLRVPLASNGGPL